MKLMLSHPRRSFIHAVRIPEVGIPYLMPVHIAPQGMNPVPALGGQAIEFKTALPQEILRLFDLIPGKFDIADCPLVPVFFVAGKAVIIRPDIGITADNYV